MQLPIYNSVTMGMGWGLFLLVQTPQSARRSHDRRVVIGANDMGWGNFSPTPFSPSIHRLFASFQTKRPRKNSRASIVGWGWEGECKKEERELGLDDFMLLQPRTTVKTTNVRFFSLQQSQNLCCDKIFNGKLLPVPPSKYAELDHIRWGFNISNCFKIK